MRLTVRVAFEVSGHPVPQGSMTASYNRKSGVAHVHHVQGTALAMWRASVRLAAEEAGAVKSFGPVGIRIVFGMKRPKAQLRLSSLGYTVKVEHWDAKPSVAPDLDKLTRAVMDALTGMCYHDDSQVVELVVRKVYGDATQIEVTDEFEGKAQLSFGMG